MSEMSETTQLLNRSLAATSGQEPERPAYARMVSQDDKHPWALALARLGFAATASCNMLRRLGHFRH